MRSRRSYPWRVVPMAVVLAGLLGGWPMPGAAQTVSGQASAVQATLFGPSGATTTVLSSTGTLGAANDALEASALTGSVPSLLTGEVLHATTIGWADHVASETSLADLALTVAGTTIGADFVMARALAVLGTGGAGASNIANLSINGVPIAVSGDPNQTVSIPGGQVVIDERHQSPTGTVVNALHVIVYGVADVVIASATADIY